MKIIVAALLLEEFSNCQKTFIVPFVLDFSPKDDAVSFAESRGCHGCRGPAETQRERASTRGLSSLTGSRRPAGGTGLGET